MKDNYPGLSVSVSSELLLNGKPYMELLASIEKNKVPLAAMRMFDYPPHNEAEEINVSPTNGPRDTCCKRS
ncbi:hypothetical protein EDD80_103206 [Anseongella ginsenosidimutans]|uniref:Uncharacterized protein n=2 Tax=Anseongella ginsenosidimutans TaxID=496056 RepID=A0A4V2UTZ1_9SPHI|nr:hypothetical protein EDD80_103206 [Anseongella ginsenosidimutans]